MTCRGGTHNSTVCISGTNKSGPYCLIDASEACLCKLGSCEAQVLSDVSSHEFLFGYKKALRRVRTDRLAECSTSKGIHVCECVLASSSVPHHSLSISVAVY